MYLGLADPLGLWQLISKESDESHQEIERSLHNFKSFSSLASKEISMACNYTDQLNDGSNIKGFSWNIVRRFFFLHWILAVVSLEEIIITSEFSVCALITIWFIVQLRSLSLSLSFVLSHPLVI